MIYFLMQLILLSLYVFRFTFDHVKISYCFSNLLFTKQMIKPRSWLHRLFFNKNNYWSRPHHIIPLAVELILIYTFSIINLGLGISVWVMESLSIDCTILIIFFLIFFVILIFSTLGLEFWLNRKSQLYWEKETKLTKKEIDVLKSEIESIYPNFFEKTNKK